MENLLARVKLLEVYSLAQMVFIKYIDRRRSNDVDRTPAALEFLHEVLIARNSRRELPVLIKRYQPQITDHDTTDPWPTRKDLRNALDNWSCYCAHAAIYVIKHLSGPIVFEPDWLAIEDLSPAFFQSIVIDMITITQESSTPCATRCTANTSTPSWKPSKSDSKDYPTSASTTTRRSECRSAR